MVLCSRAVRLRCEFLFAGIEDSVQSRPWVETMKYSAFDRYKLTRVCHNNSLERK